MYFGRDDIDEYVSVIGTPAFMDFVESIKGEGVILEKKLMGTGSKPISPMVIEIDKENEKKDIEKLDIELPVMTARIQQEHMTFSNDLDVHLVMVSKHSLNRSRHCIQGCREEIHHITTLTDWKQTTKCCRFFIEQ